MSFKLSRRVGGVCLALFAVMATGCSSFDREWSEAAAISPASGNDIVGRWEGTWQSNFNGHNGGLRAIITKVDDQTHHAKFHATYQGFLSFPYELDIKTTPSEQATSFEGEADLGALAGGMYKYTGQATSTKFHSDYSASNGDHGTFTMKRPE